MTLWQRTSCVRALMASDWCRPICAREPTSVGSTQPSLLLRSTTSSNLKLVSYVIGPCSATTQAPLSARTSTKRPPLYGNTSCVAPTRLARRVRACALAASAPLSVLGLAIAAVYQRRASSASLATPVPAAYRSAILSSASTSPFFRRFQVPVRGLLGIGRRARTLFV